jgi:TetR/AcrR family transcriptional repressor of nem operon
MQRHGYRRGCLVGNLTQELGAHNEELRDKLENVFKDWQARVADCLSDAIAAGELAPEADPQALAEFFWIGWEGAIMRAKLTRSARPLDAFASQFFAALPGRAPRRRGSR